MPYLETLLIFNWLFTFLIVGLYDFLKEDLLSHYDLPSDLQLYYDQICMNFFFKNMECWAEKIAWR